MNVIYLYSFYSTHEMIEVSIYKLQKTAKQSRSLRYWLELWIWRHVFGKAVMLDQFHTHTGIF